MTSPITPGERAVLPDALRGLAIGGILLVNLQAFAGYAPWLQTGSDATAQFGIDVLANGKFVSAFAMLFGAGMALAVERAGVDVQGRRLRALLLIGVLHGTLIWFGDILATYALVGLVFAGLLRGTRRVLWGAVVLGTLWTVLLSLMFVLAPGGDSPAGPDLASVNPAYTRPSYFMVLPTRASDFLVTLFSGLLYGPWLLALFSIGALAAHHGVLRHPEQHRALLTRVAVIAGAVGVPLALVHARTAALDTFGAQNVAILLRLLSGVALALAYGSLLGLAVAAGRRAGLKPLANVGRLALSNYLLQSVVCTLVFYGYGLGLYGRLGALECLLFGLGLFVVQLVLSSLYLRRWRVGPAEWLLRRLTYGRPVRGEAPGS